MVYLAGSLWDGAAGLLVGIVADRAGADKGRLQAWLVLGSIPLALAFLLLYWVPPLKGAAWSPPRSSRTCSSGPSMRR